MAELMSPRDEVLAQISWEISERLLKGDDPQLGEYVEQYPELEEDIRILLRSQKGTKDLADRLRYRLPGPPPRSKKPRK